MLFDPGDVHGLLSGNGVRRPSHGAEVLFGIGAPLNTPVVLFDEVVGGMQTPSPARHDRNVHRRGSSDNLIWAGK